MLAKQIIFVSFFIPFTEYYSFIAVRKVTSSLNNRSKKWIRILYILFSIAILLGLFAFPYWATTAWPSYTIKVFVNILIGFFLGKILTAFIMLFGDVLVMFRYIAKSVIVVYNKKLQPENFAINKHTLTRSQFISRVSLIVGGLFTSALGFGMTNKYRYKMHHIQVPLYGGANEFKGFKIAQISDLHSGSLRLNDAIVEAVQHILEQKPDLILFTGDLVNYKSNEFEPFIDIFKKLNAPLGVYSILGNHDYGDYVSWKSQEEKQTDFMRLQMFHEKVGWKLLKNEHVLLTWKDKELVLIGVENWSTKSRFHRYGDLNKAMAGLKPDTNALKILMSHDPSHWDAEVRPGYPDIALTLSGHTHGMQFGIDIPGLKWSPAQYIYKQWAGLYQEKDQYLYVNRGFGFIGYEGRLGILPEITLIEIV